MSTNRRGKVIPQYSTEIKWKDVKFNNRTYQGLKIKVYDYKMNRDVTVYVTTTELSKLLDKYYFAPDDPKIKNLKKKAEEIYSVYTVFVPKEKLISNLSPKELKELVEDNLYPERY
jgi:hypothetical protein